MLALRQRNGRAVTQAVRPINDHDIAPLSPPSLDPFGVALPKEGPLVYEFDVEVRPEFELPNYKGLKLKRPVKEYGDEDVASEKR